MKWIVVWLDHENVDLNWDQFDTKEEALAEIEFDAKHQNRQSVTIHGTLEDFNT